MSPDSTEKREYHVDNWQKYIGPTIMVIGVLFLKISLFLRLVFLLLGLAAMIYATTCPMVVIDDQGIKVDAGLLLGLSSFMFGGSAFHAEWSALKRVYSADNYLVSAEFENGVTVEIPIMGLSRETRALAIVAMIDAFERFE